jgi:hypothetical protein
MGHRGRRNRGTLNYSGFAGHMGHCQHRGRRSRGNYSKLNFKMRESFAQTIQNTVIITPVIFKILEISVLLCGNNTMDFCIYYLHIFMDYFVMTLRWAINWLSILSMTGKQDWYSSILSSGYLFCSMTGNQVVIYFVNDSNDCYMTGLFWIKVLVESAMPPWPVPRASDIYPPMRRGARVKKIVVTQMSYSKIKKKRNRTIRIRIEIQNSKLKID